MNGSDGNKRAVQHTGNNADNLINSASAQNNILQQDTDLSYRINQKTPLQQQQQHLKQLMEQLQKVDYSQHHPQLSIQQHLPQQHQQQQQQHLHAQYGTPHSQVTPSAFLPQTNRVPPNSEGRVAVTNNPNTTNSTNSTHNGNTKINNVGANPSYHTTNLQQSTLDPNILANSNIAIPYMSPQDMHVRNSALYNPVYGGQQPNNSYIPIIHNLQQRLQNVPYQSSPQVPAFGGYPHQPSHMASNLSGFKGLPGMNNPIGTINSLLPPPTPGQNLKTFNTPSFANSPQSDPTKFQQHLAQQYGINPQDANPQLLQTHVAELLRAQEYLKSLSVPHQNQNDFLYSPYSGHHSQQQQFNSMLLNPQQDAQQRGATQIYPTAHQSNFLQGLQPTVNAPMKGAPVGSVGNVGGRDLSAQLMYNQAAAVKDMERGNVPVALENTHLISLDMSNSSNNNGNNNLVLHGKQTFLNGGLSPQAFIHPSAAAAISGAGVNEFGRRLYQQQQQQQFQTIPNDTTIAPPPQPTIMHEIPHSRPTQPKKEQTLNMNVNGPIDGQAVKPPTSPLPAKESPSASKSGRKRRTVTSPDKEDPNKDKKLHGFRYVYYDKANRNFHACVSAYGRTINFGYVRTPRDCARAVDCILMQLEREPVNFPDDVEGTKAWAHESDYHRRMKMKIQQIIHFKSQIAAKEKVKSAAAALKGKGASQDGDQSEYHKAALEFQAKLKDRFSAKSKKGTGSINLTMLFVVVRFVVLGNRAKRRLYRKGRRHRTVAESKISEQDNKRKASNEKENEEMPSILKVSSKRVSLDASEQPLKKRVAFYSSADDNSKAREKLNSKESAGIDDLLHLAEAATVAISRDTSNQNSGEATTEVRDLLDSKIKQSIESDGTPSNTKKQADVDITFVRGFKIIASKVAEIEA